MLLDPTLTRRAIARAVRRGGPAHLHVRQGGRVVVDLRLGVGPHAVFWPFSVSKLYIATLVWALHDDGVIDVDDPVAAYWPEFAAEGKGAITVLDVLRHRSGLPRVGGPVGELAAMTDWARTVRAIEAARPVRPPADPPAYEWIAWGFILGETIERATGMRVGTALRERVLAPLGASGTFLGLPPGDEWRAVPVRGRDPLSAATAAVVNRPAVRRAVIPAAGVWTTAHDLADLLEALRAGGEGRHGRLLRPESVAAMTAPSNRGEFDRYAGSRVWWGSGVQLGHPHRLPWRASAFGRRSSPRAFGRNGSNVSMCWTDPDRGLTFVYLSGLVEPFPVNRLRIMAIEDDLIAACKQ